MAGTLRQVQLLNVNDWVVIGGMEYQIIGKSIKFDDEHGSLHFLNLEPLLDKPSELIVRGWWEMIEVWT